ncbi:MULTISPECIES: DnaD domain protein [Staphylococcus]|uniref:DnaD domain protein n=1 Tax=Staphylococcus agnetis TaxID=985762 RepID=A0AAW9YWS3_9STAP|nr:MULTISPECIES: DnaD domain protein [Staphylococcus]NHM91467.1 DnaD domain protein [Staphylococcus sp. 10602379]NJI02490.1 DnaD domain protein [Staphylococcus agnetis]
MATFRVYKESGNFVTVHKDFIHDSNISWKAKGILLYLLSRPDDWQIYETELVKHSVDGLSGLKSGIKELEKIGYIQRNRKRDAKGRLKEYEYAVYEQPNHIRFSNVGNSYIGKTYVGESHPTNNNSTNNDLTNNKDTNNVTDETIKIFQLVSKELETIQSPLKVQQLENEIESFKEDKLEIVELAINYCKEKNKGINYLIKILENWNKEGITTKDQAERKIRPKQTTNSILDELESELGDD